MKSEARNPWGVIGFSILTLGFRWLIFGPKHVYDFMFFLLLENRIFQKRRPAIWNRFLVVGAVFFSPLNPLEQDDDEEEYHDRLDVSRKFHCCSKWRYDQDAVFWKKLEEAQAVYERSFDLSTSIEGRAQKPLVGTAAAAY